MRAKPLAVLMAVMTLGAAAAGCTDDPSAAGSSASAAGANQAAGSPSPADESGKAICAEVDGDIKSTLDKVSDAEKIGPPAGFNAVSAQYSAGAALIYSHLTGVKGHAVDAATAVADAMSAIAGKYVDSNSKPDKASLNTAIDKFKTACG